MSWVLLTGASGDIGRAIALKLAREGYNLILTCFSNSAAATDLIFRISAEVPTCQYTVIKCDLSDYQAVSERLANFDIDIIVHAAGISHIGLIQDMTPDEWNRIISVNLTSCFNLSKAFLPKMIAKGNGRLLFISSIWGNEGASMEVAYSASKSGLNGFVKALAKEVAPSGISVNAIAPGLIDTKMNNHLSKDELNNLYEEIPMGRAGTTSEVAELTYHIISSPSYLTGQIITMDGGWQ
ncbi:MAG: SDR family oxidoreductase [Lachnospiraceae bacterium]|nr:SDR family oxidoreductase [Lachnospiraceae bacterium]